MENHNPLEMQNPDLNPYQPPHLSAKANCTFCGTMLPNAPNSDASIQTTLYEESINKVIEHRSDTIKNRLEPNPNKPVDKRKLAYSVIIIILALIVIGLLGRQ